MSDDTIIDRMLYRWKLANEAETDNRQSFLKAAKFALGGTDQWDSATLANFKLYNRPYESYNQIPQFINQVTNDMRMNMAQTKFVPNDDDDKEKAEVMEDIVRAIQSTSEGEVAYDAAAYTQVTGGWGYWRYYTEYEDESDADNDNQVIKIGWIPNPLMVYDDPNCVNQDRLDREWLIHAYDLPLKEFNSTYDRNYERITIQSIGDSAPDWATSEYIRIAEYWEVKSTKETIKRKGKPDRDIVTKKIIWRKCTGSEVLEEREFPGKYIPYVFVAGNQVFIDGEQKLSGLVEGMISSQVQYNRWSNVATELVSMAPLAPFIIDPDQIAGWESYWDTANVAKYAFLPARSFDSKTGKQFNTPQRANNGADISSVLALVQQAQQNFYATTGIYPASLGRQGNETSGRAINARKVEGEVSTFLFPDNMARSQRAGGRILEPLIRAVYDGSRVIKGVKEDKTTRSIKINQKFKTDKGEEKEFDLTRGSYEVMVSTGPSFTTKREQSQEAYLQLAQSTNLMEVAPDLFYAAQDFPGADKIAERYKKTPIVAQLTQGEDGEEQLPPQVVAAMQEQQQMIEQMGQALEQLQAEVQSKQIDLQTKQIEAQTKQAQLEGQLAKNQQDAQSQTLQLEARAIKAELELKARDIQSDEENLRLMESQFMTKVADQRKIMDLVNRLAAKDAEIRDIEAQRQADLANQELQHTLMNHMRDYQDIRDEIVTLNSQENTLDK